MNTNSEYRKGVYISSEAKKVWAVQLDLLNKLLEVCHKYNLKIWANGGTLLGAVREHGYIPWDDDIDMVMFRNDYDLLVSVSKQEFVHPFFFQTAYSDINYPRGHAQIRKDNTSAILQDDVFQKFHQGIFIDVFVYDYIPDDYHQLNLLLCALDNKMNRLRSYCYDKYLWFHPLLSFHLYTLKRDISKKGFVHEYEEYEGLLRQNEGRDVACIGLSTTLVRNRLNVDLFKSTIEMPFEDIMIPVPVGYDSILKKLYGNYMIPLKCPSMHGEFIVLDTEKSFMYYLPKLKRQARIGRLLYIIRKILFFI